MKPFDVVVSEIIEMSECNSGIFDMILQAPELAQNCKAGQFVHVYVPGYTLRRPISICRADAEKGTLRLVFQVRGTGTALLSTCKTGDTVDLLGPLGNGFPLFEGKRNVLLVGGGIGVPPLLGLAGYYGGAATACLGFRTSDGVILEQDFKHCGSGVHIATEDGSVGHHGYVSGLFAERDDFDCVYACGPEAMLHAVCTYAHGQGIPCYVSLEERMACGIGACLGCACELMDEQGSSYYGHVCKDGPVFDSRKVMAFAASNHTGEVKHGKA